VNKPASSTGKLIKSPKLSGVVDMERNDHVAHALASIVESSRDAIISTDLNGAITSWNRGAELLFGYTAAEIIGKPLTKLIPPDRIEEKRGIPERLVSGEQIDSFETVRRCKDGHLVDVSLTMSPIKNAKGAVVGVSKIARDISELQRVRTQQTLLLGEMKHRINNLLTVMDALGRNAIPTHDPAMEVFFGAFMGRMRALLSVGEIVVSSSSHEADLGEVAQTALRPFMVSKGRPQIYIEGPPLLLAENVAGGLALAFHELATNALKYGALKTPDGRIDLAWSIEAATTRIEWKERLTDAISEPTRRGFGSRLIKSAVSGERQGRTVLKFEPDGLRCSFEFANPSRI